MTLSIPLGALLHCFSNGISSSFVRCYWYCVEVLCGGNAALTGLQPKSIRARVVVSFYSSLSISVVALYVNLIKISGVKPFFNIAILGLELRNPTLKPPQQPPGCLAATGSTAVV